MLNKDQKGHKKNKKEIEKRTQNGLQKGQKRAKGPQKRTWKIAKKALKKDPKFLLSHKNSRISHQFRLIIEF